MKMTFTLSAQALVLVALFCLADKRHQLLALSSSSSFSSSSNRPRNSDQQRRIPDGPSEQQSQQQQQSDRRQDSLNVGRDPLLSLNLNLDAMARANAADRAQELYQRITALYDEGYYAAAPDVVSFNTVLKAYQTDPAKAIEFWENTVGQSLVEPNTRSFNIILLALAKAGLYEDAMDVLRQMQSPESRVLPDRITFNTVLLAYANANNSSRDAQAAEQAEALLQEMMDSEESSVTPDVVSFNTVIACWSQQGSPERAQALLDKMKETQQQQQQETLQESFQQLRRQQPSRRASLLVRVRPDVYSYTTVIHAWARAGNSQRGLELLQEMTDESRSNYLRPNRITYTALVQVLCREGKPEKAQLLVRDMLRQETTGSNNSDKRSSSSSSSSSSGEEEALEDQYYLPDVVTFSILLDGWARVAEDRPEQATRAVLQILKDMKTLSRTWPRMAPNSFTYTAVLTALAQTRQWDAPEKALLVLRSMTASGTDKSDSNRSNGIVQPTIIHYNAVLDAYAKSSRADKAVRAAQLWKELKDQQQHENDAAVIPDLITYNTLLACAANSFGNANLKAQSLEVGLAAFQALRRSSSGAGSGDVVLQQEQGQDSASEPSRSRPCQPPTSLTYHYLFKILRKFMQPPSKRHDWMKRAFDCCCQEGCLNQLVLNQVFSHITPDEAQDLLGPEYNHAYNNKRTTDGSIKVLVADLPDKWSRNALPCSPSSQRWQKKQ